jgi:hypothetical protein
MAKPELIPLSEYEELPPGEMKKRANDLYRQLRTRRTVREFSDRPVPREILEECLLAASTA